MSSIRDLGSRVTALRGDVHRLLLSELSPEGRWTGELSSSALSTATAVIALSSVDRAGFAGLIEGGLRWLARHVNADGGWGDTTRSASNLSTTALVWAAFGAAGADAGFPATVERGVAHLERTAGSLSRLVPAIEARYGGDRTFSVPIVMTLALSGRLGPDGWWRVRPLPFELALLPRAFLGAARLPVVSYALPALIAIGQAIQHHAPRWRPQRSWARARTLALLTTLQPPNGGFLEAIPLTSFVTMSLASMGLADHIVARRGIAFLRGGVRPDGSWPIDTNLSTWISTLAVKALAQGDGLPAPALRAGLRDWIVGQQYRVVHRYTGAAPGGWAWTDLPGGVPDADDTAGALLALHALGEGGVADAGPASEAVQSGVRWLLDLQNRDGGIPTFCRGWGTLPFDRSTPDLTAHALRAWAVWLPRLSGDAAARVERAARRALAYLERSQGDDGFWRPLWFGNERAPGQQNPVFGTAQVLAALEDVRCRGWGIAPAREAAARRALLAAQHPDGGWGGAPGVAASVEETALALGALALASGADEALARGVDWLGRRWGDGVIPEAAPIGLYFAMLWYFEKLYPAVLTADALGRLAIRGGSWCRPSRASEAAS